MKTLFEVLKQQEDAVNTSAQTAEINALVEELNSTDYRIVKAMEYSLVGLEVPYDIDALHMERQKKRDRINKLQNEIKKITRK